VLTTLTMIQTTLLGLASCAAYQVVGDCVWAECSPFGCHMRHTPKVKHYVPELLVVTYPEAALWPWKEYRLIKQPMDKASNLFYRSVTGFSLEDGHLQGAAADLQEITFLESTIVGHPALTVLPSYFLKGKATPLLSYFDSGADAILWRGGETEMLHPQSYSESPHNTVGPVWAAWGSIYPRTGFVMQPEVTKAAGVIALRSLNILTQPSTLHVALHLASSPCPYEDCIEPEAIDGSSTQVKYQRLHPKPDTHCASSIAAQIENLSEETQGVLAWTVWREYKACLPGSGKFLYSVG
jgi:integrating conjugative element protein (TIGR03756 family)